LRIWTSEYGALWAAELASRSLERVQPRFPAEFREASPGEGDPLAWKIARAMNLPDPAPVLSKLAGGRRCFLAWDGDRVAAYGWVTQGDECVGELERTFRIQHGEAYIWNCYTLPAYRRLYLYSALLSHILHTLREEGLRRAWIGSAVQNRASLRGFANAGFQPVIRILYLRFLLLRFSWMSGEKNAPAQLVSAARRVLRSRDEHFWGLFWIGRFRMAQAECV
jgi:ribosomal protein S18 acetylase RimI-like enzyme